MRTLAYIKYIDILPSIDNDIAPNNKGMIEEKLRTIKCTQN